MGQRHPSIVDQFKNDVKREIKSKIGEGNIKSERINKCMPIVCQSSARDGHEQDRRFLGAERYINRLKIVTYYISATAQRENVRGGGEANDSRIEDLPLDYHSSFEKLYEKEKEFDRNFVNELERGCTTRSCRRSDHDTSRCQRPFPAFAIRDGNLIDAQKSTRTRSYKLTTNEFVEVLYVFIHKWIQRRKERSDVSYHLLKGSFMVAFETARKRFKDMLLNQNNIQAARRNSHYKILIAFTIYAVVIDECIHGIQLYRGFPCFFRMALECEVLNNPPPPEPPRDADDEGSFDLSGDDDQQVLANDDLMDPDPHALPLENLPGIKREVQPSPEPPPQDTDDEGSSDLSGDDDQQALVNNTNDDLMDPDPFALPLGNLPGIKQEKT